MRHLQSQPCGRGWLHRCAFLAKPSLSIMQNGNQSKCGHGIRKGWRTTRLSLNHSVGYFKSFCWIFLSITNSEEQGGKWYMFLLKEYKTGKPFSFSGNKFDNWPCQVFFVLFSSSMIDYIWFVKFDGFLEVLNPKLILLTLVHIKAKEKKLFS